MDIQDNSINSLIPHSIYAIGWKEYFKLKKNNNKL
jgi:hypothetical protein